MHPALVGRPITTCTICHSPVYSSEAIACKICALEASSRAAREREALVNLVKAADELYLATKDDPGYKSAGQPCIELTLAREAIEAAQKVLVEEYP